MTFKDANDQQPVIIITKIITKYQNELNSLKLTLEMSKFFMYSCLGHLPNPEHAHSPTKMAATRATIAHRSPALIIFLTEMEPVHFVVHRGTIRVCLTKSRQFKSTIRALKPFFTSRVHGALSLVSAKAIMPTFASS